MKCITCEAESTGEWCEYHPARDLRLTRIPNSMNASGFAGPFEAEHLLSKDRRPSTLNRVVKWMLASGYAKWPTAALSITSQRAITVNVTGLNRQYIMIATGEFNAVLMDALKKVWHEQRQKGVGPQGFSALVIKWNDWPHVRSILKTYYPVYVEDYAMQVWTPNKSVESSDPKTMRVVGPDLYTSQVALNRGKIVGGEWIATANGAAKFNNLFKGAHHSKGKQRIGKFGIQCICPASIENLEILLEMTEQPLETKIEACAIIWELVLRQEAIAGTFLNRRQTELYSTEKLHRYVYRQEENPFDIFGEPDKAPVLENWKKYLNLMEPYSQQKIMCEATWKAKYVSWWVDMRVGKTPAGMMIMARALEEDLVDHFVVVAPSINLYDPWFTELEKQGKFKVCVLDEGMALDEESIKSEAYDVYLISYSSLGARLPIMQWFWSMNRVGVLADETSYIKNPDSQRAKALGYLSEHVPFAVALNGTPIAQGPQDVWPQQYFVDQGVTFGTNYKTFMDYWLVRTAPNKFALDRNQSTLFELKLSGSSIRYIRSEADQFSGKDKNFRYIVMPPSKEMKESTEEILKGFTRDGVEEYAIKENILTIYGHLRECCAGYNKMEVVPDSAIYKRVRHKTNPKVTWVKCFLKGNPGQPLVIFSENTEMEDALVEMFEKEGVSWSGVRTRTGKRLTGLDRREQIRRFQDGEVRVFLLKSTQGKGITLNRIPAVKAGLGSYPAVVYTQPTWSLVDHEQSQDRCVGTDPRTQQSISTMVYMLAIKGSIEWEIIGALRAKKKVQETLLADAARHGYSNPFSEMDLTGDDNGDEFFDSEEMEARYSLSLAPQRKLSEKMIRTADVKYRANKYGTTQKVQKERPLSEPACYLMEKIDA